jgi:hypothetical protein
MNDCRWSSLIIDRHADALQEEQAVLLEQHIVECPTCAAEDREVHRILAAAGPEGMVSPDPALLARLLPEVRRNRRVPSAQTRGVRVGIARLAIPFPAYAALALAIATASAGFWIGRAHSPAKRPEPVAPTAVSPKIEDRSAPGSLGFASAQLDATELPCSVPGDSL